MKKRSKKKIIIICSVVSFVVVICFVILFFIYNSFSLEINGKKNVLVEVKKKYVDKGAKSFALGRKIDVKTSGKVNSKKLGTYKIVYSSRYFLFEKKITRIVKVIDSVKPTINLKGDEEVTIILGKEYIDDGVEVKDNYDKKLGKKVKVTNKVDKDKIGTYDIIYEVKDSSGNSAKVVRKVNVVKKEEAIQEEKKVVSASNGSSSKVGTYIKGILIVNKKYHLPADYNPGVDPTAEAALSRLQAGAMEAGFSMPMLSGFRSYTYQQSLYNKYVARDGVAKASTYSAKAGQSEHQTGLAFDVGKIDDNYGDEAAGQWLAANAHKYGFIIRFLKGKESITGYQYEPWHIRYVGESVALDIYKKGITLEEYLGVS